MDQLVTELSTGSGPVERLLEVLPVGVFGMSVVGRLPIGAPPDVLLAELRDRTRLDFANSAFADLEGATPSALHGRPLGQLRAGGALTRPSAASRFVADGLRMERVEIRIGSRGEPPRFVEVTLIATIAADEIVGLWGAVADVTAAHDLAQRAASDSDEAVIVGESGAVRQVLAKVRQVAPTDTTVLITGETGTGKELVARAIHHASRRAARALVAINCGAISPTLVESELFGHEKGSFTGALGRKQGRFELADGGTLFLDEIGDLSAELQVKLLRVLEEGEFTRVGGTETVKVDVRVIAATHRDLPGLVRTGAFRQDLYYRLNVFPIRTPPLRDRREDIAGLARHFVARYSARLGKVIDDVPPQVIASLESYPWPGNIRELANVIERSVIVTTGRSLQLGEWATGQYQPVVPAATTGKTLEEMERDYILKTLQGTGWKVSGPGGAAERLNLKPTTLEARMKRLGIVRPV